MRFHLVDRIDGFEPGSSIRARKLTSAREDFWEGPEDDLRMPKHLVLEALCQAGSWLVILSTGRRQRAALLSVASVSFSRRPVRPGDVLDIAGSVISLDDETAVLSGTVRVAGDLVLEAEDIMCVLIGAAQLEDPADLAAREELLLRPAAT